MELYESSLIKKPSILVLNKIDTDNSRKKYENFIESYNDYDSKIKLIEKFSISNI